MNWTLYQNQLNVLQFWKGFLILVLLRLCTANIKDSTSLKMKKKKKKNRRLRWRRWENYFQSNNKTHLTLALLFEKKCTPHSSRAFSWTKCIFFFNVLHSEETQIFLRKNVRINKTNLWIFSQVSYNCNWIWMECINPFKWNYTKSCQMSFFLSLFFWIKIKMRKDNNRMTIF